MPARYLAQLHSHSSWELQVRQEYSEDGRLHRHRVIETSGATRYTAWAHNTRSHQHRLPDGSWSRPRHDLSPPMEQPAATR